MARTKRPLVSKKTPGSAAALGTGQLCIAQPKRTILGFEITGTSELIQNRWSQKAFEQMLGSHMGFSRTREAKKPRDILTAATVLNEAGAVCIPPQAIKAGMMLVASKDLTLRKLGQLLRTMIFIRGRSVPVTYDRMVPRVDMVRNSGVGRTFEERFRPMFQGWKARFLVVYDETKIPPQTIVDLVNNAGMVGVGEWRPQKNGTYGTYEVSRLLEAREEQDEVYAICQPAIQPLVIPEWALDVEFDMDELHRIMNPGGIPAEEAAE
jgi:hypothetical protein